jgi:hypothetical protein
MDALDEPKTAGQNQRIEILGPNLVHRNHVPVRDSRGFYDHVPRFGRNVRVRIVIYDIRLVPCRCEEYDLCLRGIEREHGEHDLLNLTSVHHPRAVHEHADCEFLERILRSCRPLAGIRITCHCDNEREQNYDRFDSHNASFEYSGVILRAIRSARLKSMFRFCDFIRIRRSAGLQ